MILKMLSVGRKWSLGFGKQMLVVLVSKVLTQEVDRD